MRRVYVVCFTLMLIAVFATLMSAQQTAKKNSTAQKSAATERARPVVSHFSADAVSNSTFSG